MASVNASAHRPTAKLLLGSLFTEKLVIDCPNLVVNLGKIYTIKTSAKYT